MLDFDPANLEGLSPAVAKNESLLALRKSPTVLVCMYEPRDEGVHTIAVGRIGFAEGLPNRTVGDRWSTAFYRRPTSSVKVPGGNIVHC